MNSSILIKTVRISGFRGLKNLEVELEPTTVLTGMNNAGKTSFLKALQIVFGNRQFITQDDFLIENGESVEKLKTSQNKKYTIITNKEIKKSWRTDDIEYLYC